MTLSMNTNRTTHDVQIPLRDTYSKISLFSVGSLDGLTRVRSILRPFGVHSMGKRGKRRHLKQKQQERPCF